MVRMFVKSYATQGFIPCVGALLNELLISPLYSDYNRVIRNSCFSFFQGYFDKRLKKKVFGMGLSSPYI